MIIQLRGDPYIEELVDEHTLGLGSKMTTTKTLLLTGDDPFKPRNERGCVGWRIRVFVSSWVAE